jgi:signal transduction histidine kinase
MSERNRLFLLISIMAAASLIVAGVTIAMLYRAAFSEEKARLVETAQSQARLIEAVARFDVAHQKKWHPHVGVPAEATLRQVIDAHKHYKGFGDTGEFTLARREGDYIIFLLRHRHGDLDQPKQIAFISDLADPMRAALLGKSGNLVGHDYRGEIVLAAHEPVRGLNYGIVAKIDLAEIRAPFVRAGAIALGFTVLVVLAGALSFLRITKPVIRRLKDQADELKIANKLMKKEMAERVRIGDEIKWEGKVNSALSELYGPVISPSASILDITTTILDEAKQLTASDHGYVSSIDPVTGDMITHTLTSMMQGQCRMRGENQRTLFPKAEDGCYPSLWGHSLNNMEPFFTNSPKTHKASTGIPEGHIPLKRLLSVPVMLGKELIGQISMANKDSDYTQRDLKAICRMAEYYALAIQRNRAEEELQKAHQKLESRVEKRTIELSKANTLLKQEITERKKTGEKLKQSENELRRLSSKLLTAHEEESKRIGQELHDGLAQTLSAVKIWVENAIIQLGQKDPVEAAKSLESVVPLAQGAVEEVRRISKNLRPSSLDDLGLLATISWSCQEFNTLYAGIEIQKKMEIEEAHVPDPLKIVIYRVLQEALNNIAKHSGANLVRISLKAAGGMIEMIIDDNGEGFEMEYILSGQRSVRGLGIASMKERTELSGGSFLIESCKGVGTTVRASWPLT